MSLFSSDLAINKCNSLYNFDNEDDPSIKVSSIQNQHENIEQKSKQKTQSSNQTWIVILKCTKISI